MTGRAKSTLQVFCIGTADTKLAELLFLSRAIRSSLQSSSHASTPSFKVTVVDVSASTSYCGQASISPIEQQDIDISFVPAQGVLSAFCDGQTFAGLPDDRGEAISIMSKALRHFLAKAFQQGVVAGAVGLGGSGGTSLIAPALRGSLPLGVPKLIVSTVASGNTQSYVETSDLILFPSLVDICGLNSVSRTVLTNAAAAVSGMVTAILSRTTCPPPAFDTERQPRTVGLTMFGVTTPCVTAVKDRLEKEGFETLVFHATGVGGRAMEDFVRDGFIQGVLDITTTEVADYVVGGVMACNSSRFDAIIEKKVPLVLSVGALDMVNFGAKHTIPSEFQSRNIHIHNEQVSLMRTTVDENKECARFIASKLDKSPSEICVCLPQEGVSALDAPGKPFFDPQATTSLIDELDKLLEKNVQCQVKKFPYHINDPKFADVLVDTFIELNNKNFNHKRTLDGSSEQNQVHHSKDEAPFKTLSNYRSNPYTPFHYPDAKEETLQRTDKILQQLRAQIKNGKPIIGAGAGTGISAKFEEMGGVDLIVVYNSGRFRMAGRGSLAGLLPFADANAIVLEMANEVLPVVNDVPVLAGVCGTDPFRQMDKFIKQLEATGFVGVQNFPTVGLFDGNFRQNIEETGMGYSLEVEMIRKAHNLGLLTTPYAFNEDESIAMAEAGADIIVVHMGLTTSGSIGAKTTISLDDCVGRVQAIADAALGVNPGVIILCHGGPISGPKEAEFILKNTRGVHGFYGASSMERLPVEKAIANTMRQYKSISMK